MDKKITLIYTRAYNSEATLHRCINSILNQNIRNFKYFIADNGSTDGTRKIIEQYAERNKQFIVPIYYNENKPKRLFDTLDIVLKEYNDGYFSVLDADDEYTPDFLEKMISFIEENNLEVATCGSEWIDTETGETIKHKVIDNTLLIEGLDFAEKFPYYRNFMVTVWGAVYSLDLLRRCSFEWAEKAINFSDTAFCMEAFRRAERAGVLSESLHKYYISRNTGSYRYNPDWFKACKILHQISREYLLDYGELSRQNQDYLWVLFLILLKYIIPRIQLADVDLSEKLKSLNEIFSDDMTQYVIEHWNEVGIFSNRSDFLQEIETWIYAQNCGEELENITEEIIASIKKHHLF